MKNDKLNMKLIREIKDELIYDGVPSVKVRFEEIAGTMKEFIKLAKKNELKCVWNRGEVACFIIWDL